MPSQAEPAAVLLDHCIDDLLKGRDWSQRLPKDQPDRGRLHELMYVAAAVHRAASTTPRIEKPARVRLWSRVTSESRATGRLRAIAFYRLPYLPPLWIRPEAC